MRSGLLAIWMAVLMTQALSLSPSRAESANRPYWNLKSAAGFCLPSFTIGRGFGMEATSASAISASAPSWSSLSEDLMVSVSLRMFTFLSLERMPRMSLPAVGAQEPFSIRAMVRFWRLCAAMSSSAVSMLQKMPALYVVDANTRWLQRKASATT